jgi:thioredoxin 1
MNRYLTFILILLPLALSDCKSGNNKKKFTDFDTNNPVIQLTEAQFKKDIFNYDVNKTWKYEGNGPIIIDFYADWCPPCRQLSPLVEEVAKEYQGKITVYKVNTDKETVLAQSLGITSLPTLLYIPSEGMPKASLGLVPKDSIVRVIKDVLLTR